MSRTATAILSTENLLHNLDVLKRQAPTSKVLAMVKANAYGHGLRSVAQRLERSVALIGVASIDEALALRKIGISTPILLTEGIFEPSELIIASTERFHLLLHDTVQLGWLDKTHLPIPLQVWMKLDTGLGRLGFHLAEAEAAYLKLLRHRYVAKPIKVLSHFSCSSEANHSLNRHQIEQFNTFIQCAKNHDPATEFSLCNSGGIFNFPACHYDYVRAGAALYGLSPVAGVSAESLELKPVMTLQTTLIATHQMPKGSPIGYGGRYVCEEAMPIGIIAFGYGDGYPFTARDGTPILVNHQRCPLVGRVAMDMIAVDLRSQPDAKVGDPVILWGEGLPVEAVSMHTANCTWSIVTGVQNRVKFLWTRTPLT